MRRGRRILAVAGMTALLLSNIGTATRTVFAEEQTGVIDPAAVTDETAGLQTQEVIEPQTPVESDTGSGEITAGETATDGADVAAEAATDVPDAEPVAEPTDEAGDTGPTETPATETPADENNHTEETPAEENTDAVEDTSDADDVNATEGETEIIDNTDTEVIDEEPEEETDPEEESEEEDLVLIEQTIEGKADDGASVEIVGNLPENAQAHMEAVTLDRDELDSYFGSDVVAGMDRLAVYDISIYVNDEEWEPNETVSVKVHNPDIQPIDGNAEPETEADTENIVVAHLDDGGEQIATYSDENGAEFEIAGVPAEESKDTETAEPAKETSASEATDETTDDATQPESSETSAVTEDADTTEETEPAEETTPAEQSDENAETPAAETTETDTTDVVAEVLPSESTDGDVSFETDGFSLYGFYTYTVDFYYEETKSQFPGGSTFQLSQLLDELGIADSADDVTDVTFTDTTLIEVVQEDNDWRLISLLPFTTSETLTVTFEDGWQVVIRVEDDQESNASYDNLGWQVENGSFETYVYQNPWTYDNATAEPWSTTSDGIETANYSEMSGNYNQSGVDKPTYISGIDVGNRYAELNANTAGTMYQDIQTAGGATLTWGLYHRARTSTSSSSTDTMYVIVMSLDDADKIMNYTRGTGESDHETLKSVATQILGYYDDHDSGTATVTVTKDGTRQSVTVSAEVWQVSTTTRDSYSYRDRKYTYSCTANETWGGKNGAMVDGATVYNSSSSGWSYKTAQYTVPEGQKGTRFLFVSGDTGSGDETIGNMVDVVSFSQSIDYTIEYRVWDNTQNKYVVMNATDTQTGTLAAGSTVTANNTANYSTYQYLGAYAGTATGGDNLPSDLTDETSFQLVDGKNHITLYYGTPPVKTGVATGSIPFVVFPAGMAFLALYRRTRRRFTH